VREKAEQELKRLEAMPPVSAEATVSRNYIDWLVAVPWTVESKELKDLKRAEEILHEDHYGLEKIKDRILEFLAVRQLVGQTKSSIICFVGPPGVGKSSLAKSIAAATGPQVRAPVARRRARRGRDPRPPPDLHRRLPGPDHPDDEEGGHRQPVFCSTRSRRCRWTSAATVGGAARGARSGAEQRFLDHYLDVDYDLSKVMFIATANGHPQRAAGAPRPHGVHPALGLHAEREARDRQAVPDPQAARGPRPAAATGAPKIAEPAADAPPSQVPETAATVAWNDDAVQLLIESFTREPACAISSARSPRCAASGAPDRARGRGGAEVVRGHGGPRHQLPRQAALPFAQEGRALGDRRFDRSRLDRGRRRAARDRDRSDEGQGQADAHRQAGEVMQESARAAVSYLRSRADMLGIDPDFNEHIDVHIHVPEGAIPKDGPSAGITMATALVSALTKVPVRKDIAMTGEITLRGKVLPVGGIKDKVLAAFRAGITELIMPKENEKDLEDIPPKCATCWTCISSSRWTKCCAWRSTARFPRFRRPARSSVAQPRSRRWPIDLSVRCTPSRGVL
jgi:ATP-dependent Lon protease